MIKLDVGKAGIFITVTEGKVEQWVAITAQEAIELFGQISKNADKLEKMARKEKNEKN